MQQGQMAYDRAITVFSPDGRLFQVEYAREAVKKGSTALGIKFKDGVALISEKKVRSRLVEKTSLEKIQLIDDRVAAVTSGLVADARVLIDFARISDQQEKVTYGSLMNIENLVKRVADQMQQYTQYGGVRPYGVSIIFAGLDSIGPRLFDCDPAGTINEYKCVSIGAGKDQVTAYLEKEYKENLSEDEAIRMGIAALKSAVADESSMKEPEIASIKMGETFHVFTSEEVSKYLN
ncbi:archaeal proteasome endopeptidase complex subunit alpha [Picrophilus oshimae]|uniref:Proteasome subunit alpha n=2 Tax=Picrophilus torridus (strain ATCC 700027 / DSM 9790 / JCM 10055 / NBRC 100828 / KAW 2/3) TaxID=1122961 RepID=PSA_PICTO|nr:archaeal proteasome endopeptidase complex subunit alpha [Picrophilus oshimae]Q6L0W3.1 RecName: Full=Proteasome subunit alpha; AltName: Full=20S proteasome alpha subunit; AltName: Full=Proteasome core protein PsmA [Picrophilus oshimae DSM 9789]AAT43389.1 proteasome alpha subunit [Picrophilus oshimae DSM 9789]SMD30303.1 proteasome alpha subunit [Picrophilus oshimae DSM 9789]